MYANVSHDQGERAHTIRVTKKQCKIADRGTGRGVKYMYEM